MANIKDGKPSKARSKSSQEKAWAKIEERIEEQERNFGSAPPDRLGVLPFEPELEFGERLKRARTAKGLTQGELAEQTVRADKDGKGLSRAVISLYEAGTNKPGTREMRMLCEVLRVTPSYFIYGDDDPFDTFLDRHRYRVVGGNNPEFRASLAYCFKKLDPHHRASIMDLMLTLLRSRTPGFDLKMDEEANQSFLDDADRLRELLEARAKKKAEEGS
jgi:transcriptional regulator with XRE-family HTH domain